MVITISSIKGGVGKSSTVLLLANNLASRGYSVLVLDLDLNNSTTIYYTMDIEGIREISERKNIVSALTQGRVEENIITSRIKNVSVIPSSLSLCDIRSVDYRVLKKVLKSVRDKYDFIVIDTSPTYDNLVMNAINASDLILSPAEMTEYNFNMCVFLMNKIRDELPEKYERTFILVNKWKEQYQNFPGNLQNQVYALYEKEFKNILDVKLPKSERFDRYTHFDEKLSLNDRNVGTVRLTKAVNALVNRITGEERVVEAF